MKKVKLICVVFVSFLLSCNSRITEEEPNDNLDDLVQVNDSVFKLIDNANSLVFKAEDHSVLIDSSRFMLEEAIRLDSNARPAYVSLITFLQMNDDYKASVEIIDLYLANHPLDYSFIYQKSLSLYCIAGKEDVADETMKGLWRKLELESIEELTEDNVSLFLIVSTVLNKKNKQVELRNMLLSKFKMESYLIDLIIRDSRLDKLKPCASVY